MLYGKDKIKTPKPFNAKLLIRKRKLLSFDIDEDLASIDWNTFTKKSMILHSHNI